MKISLGMVLGDLKTTNGFGYSGYNMVRSLQRLGHEVPFRDPTAPIEIFFSHPTWYNFSSKNAYHIGYTPWESSKVPLGWSEIMNECDEIWAPSPIVASWFENAGVKCVKVYEHGVESVWTPTRRRPDEKLRFLHMGEPAPRKGGQLTLDAFREAFGDNQDVHLTIKAHRENTVRAKTMSGSIIGQPQEIYKNVSLITKEMELEELVALFHLHDALIYPSFGEGFGLIPLQALATGMIVVSTDAWAPYKEFILPECRISSSLGDSPWPQMHPGQVYFPNKNSLVEILKNVYSNYSKLAGSAYKNSFYVHKRYDWDSLTEHAFANVIKKFSHLT